MRQKMSRNSPGGEGSPMTLRKERGLGMTEQDATITAATNARLQIDYWPLERLVPFARNARTHSPSQVAEIAGSIRAFGFSNPILVGAQGDVIAGHGRLAAARQLGLVEVPVIVLTDLSE